MKLCDVIPENEDSWDDKTIIEIDVDWAHDEVIADTINLISKYNVDTTWFATHDSAIVKSLQSDSNFEVGIHPNFMPLLRGDDSNGRNFEEVIDKLLNLFPDAKCSKGHALVDSSAIIAYLTAVGITHDNTMFVDAPAVRPLCPWRLWTDMIRVPLCWEDDYACVSPYENQFSNLHQEKSGLRVFGFHPLHIYLNTESLSRYEEVKSFAGSDISRLRTMRYDGIGTRTRFLELLEKMSGNTELKSL